MPSQCKLAFPQASTSGENSQLISKEHSISKYVFKKFSLNQPHCSQKESPGNDLHGSRSAWAQSREKGQKWKEWDCGWNANRE